MLYTSAFAADSNEKQKVKAYAKKMYALEQKGRDMEALRVDRWEKSVCMEKMRKLQPVARKFMEESVVKFPGNVGTYFGAAGYRLMLCVSCRDDALLKCDEAHADVMTGLNELTKK